MKAKSEGLADSDHDNGDLDGGIGNAATPRHARIPGLRTDKGTTARATVPFFR